MATYDPMPVDDDGARNAHRWGDWLRATVTDIDTRVSTLESAGVGGGTTSPRPVFVQVVSADAPAWEKVGADTAGTLGSFLCDGTADDVQIQAASDLAAPWQSRNASSPAAAAQLGKVQLSGGRFNLAASVDHHTGVWIGGLGVLTEVRAVGLGASHMFTLSVANDHLCRLSDMWLDGNFASGGTGNGVDWDMTASGNTSTYPDTNPDADSTIHNLFLSGFSTGTTRTGIRVWAASTANNRGTMISQIQGRGFTGDGISYESASDSYISDTHIGNADGAGHRVAGGDTKLTNVKSFFCATGYEVSSSRALMHGVSAQDNAIGVNISPGTDCTGAAWIIDSCSTDGLIITNSVNLGEVTVVNRTGGRYATQTNGVRISGTVTDAVLSGRITPAGITNKFVGSPGSRFRTWMPDGTNSNAFN